jgi:hypothetical protein
MEKWLAEQVKSQHKDQAENVLSLLPLCVTPTPTAWFSHLFVVSVRQELWLAHVCSQELLQLLCR